MNILVDELFEKKQQLFDCFGFQEDIRKFPVEDLRDVYWIINDYEIYFHDKPLTKDVIESGDHYVAELFYYRFYDRAVWSCDELSMILIDTHCDHNIMLGIFDNKKECNKVLL